LWSLRVNGVHGISVVPISPVASALLILSALLIPVTPLIKVGLLRKWTLDQQKGCNHDHHSAREGETAFFVFELLQCSFSLLDSHYARHIIEFFCLGHFDQYCVRHDMVLVLTRDSFSLDGVLWWHIIFASRPPAIPPMRLRISAWSDHSHLHAEVSLPAVAVFYAVEEVGADAHASSDLTAANYVMDLSTAFPRLNSLIAGS